MHSPTSIDESGDPEDASGTVQGTLDAFRSRGGEDRPSGPRTEDASPPRGSSSANGTEHNGINGTCQRSIDTFMDTDGGAAPAEGKPAPGSRALEGIILERSIEVIALREASNGITRDELLLAIARECDIPLERLDLVDGYLTDLELEGKIRLFEDLIVLAREGDEDLCSGRFSRGEFLERYRRRYLSPQGGGGS